MEKGTRALRRAGGMLCAVGAVALCLWCFSDNLLPFVAENGARWTLRAAGLTVRGEAVKSEPEAAEAEPGALAAPENELPAPSASTLDEDGILSPWKEPTPAATPDPARETAPVEEQVFAGGEEVDGFFVRDTTESGVNLLEELEQNPDVQVKRDGSPVVLLYSTHTCESYLQQDADWYYLDDSFRSTDPEQSVVAVGARAKEAIEAGGFGVVHDTTMHDYPAFSGCYQRSMETVQRNLEQHPTIQITVDIHRDAIGEQGGTHYKPTVVVNGKKAAQIMIMTGCDLSEDPLFPDWRENLHLALRLQQQGEALFPGLYRPLSFVERNYNMHASHGSILVEVGTEVNTQAEAEYAGEMLGETILAVLNTLVE